MFLFIITVLWVAISNAVLWWFHCQLPKWNHYRTGIQVARWWQSVKPSVVILEDLQSTLCFCLVYKLKSSFSLFLRCSVLNCDINKRYHKVALTIYFLTWPICWYSQHSESARRCVPNSTQRSHNSLTISVILMLVIVMCQLNLEIRPPQRSLNTDYNKFTLNI